MLALYLHLVGTVCRDVERTVEGKILKVSSLACSVQWFQFISHCLGVFLDEVDALCRCVPSLSCACLLKL